ncbi:hypothetical protein V490_05656, partial [Pseudogymnoascus sp. VKM F-3557]
TAITAPSQWLAGPYCSHHHTPTSPCPDRFNQLLPPPTGLYCSPADYGHHARPHARPPSRTASREPQTNGRFAVGVGVSVTAASVAWARHP